MSLGRGEMTSPRASWDFNAPQYVDFVKISAGLDVDSLEELEDYFNYDHEAGTKVNFENGAGLEIPTEMPDTDSPTTTVAEGDNNVTTNTNLANCFTGLNVVGVKQDCDLILPKNNCPVGNNCTDNGLALESSFARSEAADVMASPSECRNRFRTILTINSARKRLSMSVDRGREKMRQFRMPADSTELEKQTAERKRIPSEKRYVQVEMEMKPSHSRQLFDGPIEERIINALISDVKAEDDKKAMQKAIPHPGVSYKLSQNIKLTEIKPFSFEKRDLQLMAKKEEFIRKVWDEEKKARIFKAQPFPEIIFSQKPSKQQLKQLQPKQLQQQPIATSSSSQNLANSKVTAAIPFNFHTQVRALAKQQQQHHVHQQQNVAGCNNGSGAVANKQPTATTGSCENKESVKNFKAKPASVLQKNPFRPSKAHQHTTDHAAFSLNTQQRAEKRAEWESYVKLKEQRKEEERLLAERRKEEEKLQETKKLRALTVHKANPAPNFRSSVAVLAVASASSSSSSTQDVSCSGGGGSGGVAALNKSCVSVDGANPTSKMVNKENESSNKPPARKGCIPRNSAKPKAQIHGSYRLTGNMCLCICLSVCLSVCIYVNDYVFLHV
ncbi:hypothetical protein HELRODRAFT_192725 [Helobdella robusta]|uniref:TPX2 C-terminal domain-containing protein n=1 Tax=Helobdella robusta TaxID=6412 RepID=T1FU83_HELRO|nr:hypothetical protein HELRODRAFT_192725 [Helobdella robusta]ESO00079.1 hypothetical protein HELRODRAFT_192725 [Helobdella robusta]